MLAGFAMLGVAIGLFALTMGAIVLFLTQYKRRRLVAVLSLIGGMVCAIALWALTFMAWSFGGS